MKRIVADAASRFDWVIVDSPPVGVLADAHLVSETVDAAILVVRAGVTRFPDLEAAADTLGRERILGVVLNAVDPTEIRGEDYTATTTAAGVARVEFVSRDVPVLRPTRLVASDVTCARRTCGKPRLCLYPIGILPLSDRGFRHASPIVPALASSIASQSLLELRIAARADWDGEPEILAKRIRALECPPGAEYDEETFLYFLAIEQARAEAFEPSSSAPARNARARPRTARSHPAVECRQAVRGAEAVAARHGRHGLVPAGSRGGCRAERARRHARAGDVGHRRAAGPRGPPAAAAREARPQRCACASFNSDHGGSGTGRAGT